MVQKMVRMFLRSELTLEQCRELVNFAKEHTDEIEWKGLEGEVADHHMKDFYSCPNAICVEDLHFVLHSKTDLFS